LPDPFLDYRHLPAPALIGIADNAAPGNQPRLINIIHRTSFGAFNPDCPKLSFTHRFLHIRN